MLTIFVFQIFIWIHSSSVFLVKLFFFLFNSSWWIKLERATLWYNSCLSYNIPQSSKCESRHVTAEKSQKTFDHMTFLRSEGNGFVLCATGRYQEIPFFKKTRSRSLFLYHSSLLFMDYDFGPLMNWSVKSYWRFVH